MYDIDIKKVKTELIEWIKNWFEENGNGCNAIIGLSGGKDSTIVAKLCVEALGKEHVIGVAMPDTFQELNDADKIAEYLGIRFINAPIGKITAGFHDLFDERPVTEQTIQNIPPRVRMTTLYAIAQSYNVKDAKPESVKLSFSRTYGAPAVTDTPTIQARDLSKLTPVYKFRMPFNYVPQGYDYHHNKIYFMRGDGAEEEERVAGTNKNWARVYYISPQTGKTLVQEDLPWVDDIAMLKSEGITDLGYFEPEGIKVKDGIIYFGFASKDAGKSPERRINIFKYQQ